MKPKARRPLTDRDEMTMQAIREYVAAKGYGPSLRNLADATGLSYGTVQHSVLKLHETGLIQRDPNVGHSIRLVGAL